MVWRVRKQDVDYFVSDLWKDVRSFAISKDNEFGKDCFSNQDALVEADVLSGLGERVGREAVPRVLRVEGSVLFMERVPGIRLFDLVRHLRYAQDRHGPIAIEAREALLANARERLRLIQLALVDMHEDGMLGAPPPYPLGLKVRELLEFFIRVLDLPKANYGWSEELSSLDLDWCERYAKIPFRDATTKNMFARLTPVSSAGSQDEDAESWLASQVEAHLDLGTEHWHNVPLTDVDFSSVTSLSSPEDDPISLYFHEWTSGTIPLDPDRLVLDPALGDEDPARAALTLLIRYLRFGGRKLAYRLVNSHGFSVRFAYDNPLHYFESARKDTSILDASFPERAIGLLGLVEQIAQAVRNATPQDEQITRIDHVRRSGRVSDYWQQTPLEGGRR